MFLLYVQVKVSQNMLKLRWWSLAFPYIKFSKEKGMELVPLPHFLHYFWIKIFLMLYFITWPNFIAWLSLLLEILDNICTAIMCCPVCGAIHFEIKFSFLIKPFFYITKNLGQKRKYLKNEKSFYLEIKNIFHHF